MTGCMAHHPLNANPSLKDQGMNPPLACIGDRFAAQFLDGLGALGFLEPRC